MCSRPGVAEGEGPNSGTAVIALGWKSRTRPVVFLWKTMGKGAAQDCCHTTVFGGLTILPLQQEEGQDGCFILARSWGGS